MNTTVTLRGMAEGKMKGAVLAPMQYGTPDLPPVALARACENIPSKTMSLNGCASNHLSKYADVDDSPCVLSIQSHVVHGYVGNKSATFPLQILGFEVDAINTVQFSTHTHYEHFRGHVITNSQMGDLIDGLHLNKVDNYTHLLTGYSRDPQALLKVANVVKDLRQKNPLLIYVCDPVMGDDGKMYVPEEILPVYQETIIPLADIVTPNQFEAELLTGVKINNVSDANKAIQCLHAKGVKVVILSSTELGDENKMLGLASILDGDCYSIKIPKFPVHFTGTGDLFTALMLAWIYKTNYDLKLSLEKTIATMQHIIKDTYLFAQCKDSKKKENGKMTSDQVELRLIQNKSFIEKPVIEIEATVYRN